MIKKICSHEEGVQFVVMDIQSGNPINTYQDEETAYRVAIGLVRTEVFKIDDGKRWKSLSEFDRDAIQFGFEEMYMKLKNFEGISLPQIIEKSKRSG